jgi:hypothetical protein
MKRALALVLLACAGCSTTKHAYEPLATVRADPHRDTYAMKRVGVLPILGRPMRPEDQRALQSALATQLGTRLNDAEIIEVSYRESDEAPTKDAYLSGRIDPQTVLAMARRFNFDGLVVTHVTDRQAYAPQRLGLEVELTSCDTGLPIWSASLRLDAANERTQDTLRAWFENERGQSPANETVELYLLSPQRFAEFAAAQIGAAY